MRIDRGPSLSEITSSAGNGAIVEFRNVDGGTVRGRVLNGKLDPGIGRVALVLEEEGTGLIWFARYRYGRLSCSSGDIITWNLKSCELVDLAGEILWRKCSGE